MSLSSLISYISNSQIITELLKRIKKHNELNIIGTSRYAKSIILNKKTENPNLRSYVIGYFDDRKSSAHSKWSINFPLNFNNRAEEGITVHYAFDRNGYQILGQKRIQ